MNRLTSGAAALALCLAACSETGTEPPLRNLPRELSVGEQQLISASNGFAFDLLHATLAADTGATNLFISPLSVSVALGMTLNGAAGTTAGQMRSVLGYGGLPQADVNAGYHDLIGLLGRLDASVTWRLANSVWYDQGFAFNSAFFDTTVKYFDALVSPLDFSSPNAAATINQWVSDQTAGRIPKIVPDPLSASAVMYLINAIYFKGSWTTQFDPAQTRTGPFHTRSGAVGVTMMHHERMPVRSGWSNGTLLLELPYARGAYAMTIAVPQDSTAIDSIARHVTEADWNAWTLALRDDTGAVILPKFTMTYGAGLNTALKAMGMTDAFCTSGVADFTPLAPSVCIDTVVHKTFLLVDEVGTEAAAVTSIEIRDTAAPVALAVDRPFLFAIRERLSGTIIFLGVIRNPAAS